jgi:hypothetical protein
VRSPMRTLSILIATGGLVAAAVLSISQQSQAPAETSPASAAEAPKLPNIKQIEAILHSPKKASQKAAMNPIDFAWLAFMKLNWPALSTARGKFDRNKPFGGPGFVVWQTFKTSQNLYVPPGQTPVPWNQGPIYQPPALQSEMIDGKVLTDNNGNPVMYEVRESEATFNYIIQRNLYTQAGQLKLLQGGLPVIFPAPAMEIKASWRFLGAGDDASHYLTATVLYRGTVRVVGLNGLHITSKVLPNWLWCTFEQIENSKTTPVKLELPIAPEVQKVNQHMQAAFRGTKWAYYRLDGVQTAYADNPNAADCIVNAKDSCLANSQIETYFQGSSSCITCHALASIGPGGARYSLWSYRGGDQQGYMGSPPPLKQDVSLDFVWSMREAQ